MRLERDGEAANPGPLFHVNPFDDPEGDFDGDLFGAFDFQSFEDLPPDSGEDQPISDPDNQAAHHTMRRGCLIVFGGLAAGPMPCDGRQAA